MNKISGKPNNDRNIFESVTSLMKAQAYELTALPQRNRPRSVYQFNLLSIIETDLVRLDFSSNGDIAETEVDEETYVARYIIAKRQTFARIHIVRFAALFKVLNRYNALHEANVAFFESLNKRFYDEAVRSHDKTELFWKEFIEQLSAMIRWRYKFGEELGMMAAKASMSWSVPGGATSNNGYSVNRGGGNTRQNHVHAAYRHVHAAYRHLTVSAMLRLETTS